MTTQTPDHDLNHEVYIDPKDHKEHINHGMIEYTEEDLKMHNDCLLYTSPSPRDVEESRMPSSA